MKLGLLCLKWLNTYTLYVSFIYRSTGHDSKQIQFAWYVLSHQVHCICIMYSKCTGLSQSLEVSRFIVAVCG